MFFRMVYKSGQIFLPFCHNSRVWQTDRRTDRQTDRRTLHGQTEFSSLDRVCIPCSAVKKSLLHVLVQLIQLVSC